MRGEPRARGGLARGMGTRHEINWTVDEMVSNAKWGGHRPIAI